MENSLECLDELSSRQQNLFQSSVFATEVLQTKLGSATLTDMEERKRIRSRPLGEEKGEKKCQQCQRGTEKHGTKKRKEGREQIQRNSPPPNAHKVRLPYKKKVSQLTMSSIQDGLLSSSFARNAFVTAFGGSISFGEVKFTRGFLAYEEREFNVPSRKIREFLSGLKACARNLLTDHDEKPDKSQEIVIEVSKEEYIVFSQNTITKKTKDEEICQINFDLIKLLHFLQALTDVAFFITNPTSVQYAAMNRIFRVVNTGNANDFETYTQAAYETEDICDGEKMLLRAFFSINKDLLDFLIEIRKLSSISCQM